MVIRLGPNELCDTREEEGNMEARDMQQVEYKALDYLAVETC